MKVTDEQSKKLRYLVLVSGLGMAAFCVAIFFFCPRFVYWHALQLDYRSPAMRNPEINRARYVLDQIANPFVKITDASNIAIQWRVLFPLIGHFLHLPVPLYMAIPHIGCVIALAFVAHLIVRETGRWDWAFLAATLTATGSWFFVSTGWLTYADSWYLLGLLIVSFSSSRAALVTACLLEPFIDERFILSLPLVLVVRLIVFTQLHPTARTKLLWDLAIVAALNVPFIALRLILLHSSDSTSNDYIRTRMSELHSDVPWTRYAEGIWMGMRGAWLLALFAIGWLFREKRWLAGGMLAGAVLLSVVTGLVIAADIGRSMSALFPAALLGLIFLAQARPQWVKRGLPILLGFNLFLPASNVITLFTQPVFYLYTEIDRYQNPPRDVSPQAYVDDGQAYLNMGRVDDARKLFDTAIQLDDQFVPAFLARTLLFLKLEDLPNAAADSEKAEKISPKLPDVLFIRGVVLMKQGQNENAARLFQSAVDLAARGWPQEEQCRALIAQLRPAATPAATPNGQGANFRL